MTENEKKRRLSMKIYIDKHKYINQEHSNKIKKLHNTHFKKRRIEGGFFFVIPWDRWWWPDVQEEGA